MNRHERRKQQKRNPDSSTQKLSRLGTLPDPKMEIPIEKLGPSGIPYQLHVLAIFPNDVRKDEDRLADNSQRVFKINATLSKTPSTNERIDGHITQKDGASYIMAPTGAERIQLSSSGGSFHIISNPSGELSFVEFKCVADSIFTARCLFQRAVLPVLDHISYLNNCPIMIDKISFNDEKNGCQTVDFVGPYQKLAINKTVTVLHEKLRPVYSLYREAQNSSSHFYKFLCYYKILEGLLTSLRADYIQTARLAGTEIKIPRQLVPDHPELQDHLREHVGTPLKAFFDKILTPEFRNAVAHFGTTDHGVLNMSDPVHLAKYAGMIHISELCARLAIADHETLLSNLQ
jgi:hypothetical protein